jgi:hypothetical protein
MKTNRFQLIILLALAPFACLAQQAPESFKMQIPLHKKITVSDIKTDWGLSVKRTDAPIVPNNSEKYYRQQLKQESALRWPQKTGSPMKFRLNESDTLVVLKEFEANKAGNSVPNDNTIAVSNDGRVLSAINSNLIMFDPAVDSIVRTVSLQAFSDTLDINTSQYDPKLLYDPESDRFIAVYLAGTTDSTSNIIAAFSNTSDPNGTWNLYAIPGDPFNDTSWSDYPAIALSHDELFITMNLLHNGGEWQTSFRQSVIWQINKSTGYSGSSLDAKVWHNLQFDNVFLRKHKSRAGWQSTHRPGFIFPVES